MFYKLGMATARIFLVVSFAFVFYILFAYTLVRAETMVGFYNICIQDSEGVNIPDWNWKAQRIDEFGVVQEEISGTTPAEACSGGTFSPGNWTVDAGEAIAKTPSTQEVTGGSVYRWDFVYDENPAAYSVLEVQVLDQYSNPAPQTQVIITSSSGVMHNGFTIGGQYTATVRQGATTVQVGEQVTSVAVLTETAVITFQQEYELPGEEWLQVAYRGYEEDGTQIVAPYVEPEVLSPEGWDCTIEYPGGEVPCADSIEDAPEITLPATVQAQAIQSVQSVAQLFQVTARREEISTQGQEHSISITKTVEVPTTPWMQQQPTGDEEETSKEFRFWLDPNVYNTLETKCILVSREMGLYLVVNPCPDRPENAVVIPIPRGYGYTIQVTVVQRDNLIRFPVPVPTVPGEGPKPYLYFQFVPAVAR